MIDEIALGIALARRTGDTARSMTQETDWEARYQSGDMPWEKGAASPGLIDFLGVQPNLERGSVLVPGCGTGHDARALAAAGFRAVGLDLAPSAVRLAQERTRAAGLVAEFRLGDFLAAAPAEPFDWIFEHTLYCAIAPDRREDYAAAVLRWLKPGGQFLAVHYLIPDAEGPPFGATRAEILGRFKPAHELIASWVPRSYPNRAGLEMMFWWKRKAG